MADSNKRYNDLDEIAAVFQQVNNTTLGKEVFHILKTRFSGLPAKPNPAGDGIAQALFVQHGLGNAEVVGFIDQMVNHNIRKGNEDE